MIVMKKKIISKKSIPLNIRNSSSLKKNKLNNTYKIMIKNIHLSEQIIDLKKLSCFL